MTRGEARLKRERTILTVFVVRQTTSVVILAIIAVQALQLPDRRLGYLFAPVALAFFGWVAFQTTRFLRVYRQRRERLLAGGGPR